MNISVGDAVALVLLIPLTINFYRRVIMGDSPYNGHQILKKFPENGYILIFDGRSIKHEVTDQVVYDAYILKRHNEILLSMDVGDL